MNAHPKLPKARTIQEWWSPAALADMRLTDLPGTERNINDLAERDGWRRPGREFPADPNGVWRKRQGRGGGFEYRIDLLPMRARAELVYKLHADLPEPRPTTQSRHAEMWASYDALPERKKAKAREKLDVLLTVRDLEMAGEETFLAIKLLSVRTGVSVRTIYNWKAEVEGKAQADWLPHLAPRHFGSVKSAECDDAAWEWYKAQYLRQEQPSHAESYRLLKRVAAKEGWRIPSAKTLERRIAELSAPTKVFLREGPDALKRMVPAQERDRSIFHALEAVNADGHTWDVFVEWPDGSIGRPNMVAFQDLFSGTILSWRVDRNPNKDLIRLAFCDVVEVYGIPDHCTLDNGRDFASKWITGGTPNRYRFKVKEEEPLGILPALGVQVHWTQPYHGQAKPIERAFRDFCMNIAKHPRFGSGAWTGNTVANKPENYASKAVPLKLFLEVLSEGIREHNERIGRRTKVCGGKQSFIGAFRASYEASPIRQASVAQKRMLLLAAEMVKARDPDGAVFVAENRYWSEFLTDQIGKKVILRLDPQALHDGVHVERADGVYLCFAPCVDAVGFYNTEAARAHAKAKGEVMRAWKTIARAEQSMSLAEAAALMPSIEAPEAPESKIVRPLFRTAGNAALKVDTDIEHDSPAVPISLQDAIRRMRPGHGNGADD